MKRRNLKDELLEPFAGKPLGMVWASMPIIGGSDEIVELFARLQRPGGMQGIARIFPRDAWLSMYRRTLGLFLTAASALTGMLPSECREFWQAVHLLRRMSPRELQAELEAIGIDALNRLIREMHQELVGEIRTSCELMEREASGLPTDHEPHGDVYSLELQFFCRVWMPCWIRFRKRPSELLRSARGGDLNALADLLLIDKTVIADPGIVKVLQEAALEKNTGRFDAIVRAMGARRRGRFSKETIKASLAGLISELAQSTGTPMTEPEVRRLFDVKAKMSGHARDIDLPPGSDALAKKIGRNRNWKLPRVGQKSPFQVSG